MQVFFVSTVTCILFFHIVSFTTKTMVHFLHLISKLILHLLLSSVVQDGATRGTEHKEAGMYYWTRGWLTKLTYVKVQLSRKQLVVSSIL